MEEYKIKFKRSFHKELKKIPKNYADRILKAIDLLAYDPTPESNRPLSIDSQYRIRVGPYRAVYEVNEEMMTVLILRVAHRQSVYKK